MTVASEWLENTYRPGRAGHPEEWRTEAVRQVVFLGLSERQVAKNLGVSNRTVSRWVRDDAAEAWADMRALGWVQKRPDAAEREAVRQACISPEAREEL